MENSDVVKSVDRLTEATVRMHNVLCEILYMLSEERAQEVAEVMYSEYAEEKNTEQRTLNNNKGGPVKRDKQRDKQ